MGQSNGELKRTLGNTNKADKILGSNTGLNGFRQMSKQTVFLFFLVKSAIELDEAHGICVHFAVTIHTVYGYSYVVVH